MCILVVIKDTPYGYYWKRNIKMEIHKKVLAIYGMTCINCQNRIENELKHTEGIYTANVSYSRGIAEI